MHFRTKIINTLIRLNNYSSYLEIGVDDCSNFDNVNIVNKVSVDPSDFRGIPMFHMKSEEFFKLNTQSFDIIFIDGLHVFDTAYNDLLCSLKILKHSGTILLHDTFPKKYEHQTVPPSDPCWTGDVWKVILKSQINLLEVDIKTYDVESGLTLITKNDHSRIKNEKLQEIYEYEYFEKNFKEILNLIEFNL
jgi:hypothetical protein